MRLHIGLMLDTQDGMDWDLWTSLVAEVEALGYDSLWCGDHLTSLTGHDESSRIETWTALTIVAATTKRLRFGPLVSPITWHHPSILALTAASVDTLSGGRLEVGIGAGWNAREHRAFGIEMPSLATRCAMLGEAAQVMRLLWADEVVTFNGRYYQLDAARARPRPVQRPGPPLVIGGTGERRTLPIVARYADEWNAYSVTPARYRAKRAVLERCCEEAGRDPAELSHSVVAPIAVGATEADAEARVARLRESCPVLFAPAAGAPTLSSLREQGWIAGTPEQIVDQIGELETAGVSRVVLETADIEDSEPMRIVARDVIPAL